MTVQNKKEAVLLGSETAAEAEIPAQNRPKVQESRQGRERARYELNLDLGNKRLKLQVILNKCTLTAGYRNRYFVLNDVNGKLHIDTKKTCYRLCYR